MTAEARARDLLQHQIDAALKNDHAVFNASFAAGTVVFLPDRGPMTPNDDASGALGGTGPDGAGITKSTIAKLVANGTADAVWFYAEVTVTGDGPNYVPGTVHVVELLAADKDWHVVAASLDEGHEIHGGGDNFEMPDGASPPDGPLAKLVPPTALIAAAPADAILVGDKGVSDAAHLKALDPLTIYKSANEVHAAGYGFLQATADHPVPGTKYINRVNVQLFAVPNPDKSWKVVLAQYSGQ